MYNMYTFSTSFWASGFTERPTNIYSNTFGPSSWPIFSSINEYI